jgi:DNA-binding transcriptional LysR family regulator
MDPRHLVQLAGILEHGSISRASRHLYLTQPTLTHNMQVLEAQAGGRLFERSRSGVRSTPLGERLAREGRAIGRRLKDAAEISARHRGGLRATLRLGTGPLVGAALVPALAQALLLQHPDTHLSVQSDRPHLLVDQLVDGRYDLVIAPSWLDLPPPGIERVLLLRDHLGVFCGAAHPLAAAGALAPDVAQGQRWLSLDTASPFDQHVRDMLDESGLPAPRIEITMLGEAFVLLRFLAQGTHLAVLPRFPPYLLRQHFPLVELSLAAQPRARDIFLWCRGALLEDAAFAPIRELITRCAAEAAEQAFGAPAPERPS